MKKKVRKYVLWVAFLILAIATIYNMYKWNVCGEQTIKISTAKQAYANSDLSVSITAQKGQSYYINYAGVRDNGEELETKTKVKFLNSKGRKVKGTKVSYDKNNVIISIPDVEAGNYTIEAKVSSKEGKDTVKKEIYVSKGNAENVTISMDKGIYKPGDIVKFRTLITNKEDDKPISEDVNVSIYDGNDNKVYNQNVKTSDYGILSGEFTLASEVNSGLYKLVVKTSSNETTKQFKVNPYVAPKYEVKVNFDKKDYLVGDKAKINVEAKYFFGEPVVNAKLKVYVDDEKDIELKTDANGIASFEYETKVAKQYNVKVEAVDSSNYYVETASNFVAGTDLFEIELLSEYGGLINGQSNDIYVFTKKADGTPVKTYVTVSSGKFTKQVATDANGVGKFTIDVDVNDNEQLENMTYSIDEIVNSNEPIYYERNYTGMGKRFNVIAENMDGEKVQKNIEIEAKNQNLILSTDKAKYNQNEDIKIKTVSTLEGIRNIYLFKNDKLLKTVTTDMDETTVNLGDVYGLIDIYVKEQNNTYKRTIFIKPAKALNIGITTDKPEYKPGENISISFETTDENKSSVEAALLVSMLDNSILNLADNDMSIDNIKLALSDIQFTNELDAATLYTCIVDDKSEETVMALLLKQGNKDISISEERLYGYEEEEKAQALSIILLMVVLATVIVYVLIKSKGFRVIMKHALNFIILSIMMNLLVANAIDSIFYHLDYTWLTFITITSISLAVYALAIAQFNEYILRTSISIVLGDIIGILLSLLIGALDVSANLIFAILALIVLIFVILYNINEKKELKFNKFIKSVIKELKYIGKYIVAVICAIIVSWIVFGICYKIFDEVLEMFILSIGLVGIYYFNYLFNIRKKGKEINIDKRKILTVVIIVLAIIGVIAIIDNMDIRLLNTAQTQNSRPNFGVEIDNAEKSEGTANGNGGFGGVHIAPDTTKADSYKSVGNSLGIGLFSWGTEAFETGKIQDVEKNESAVQQPETKEIVTDNKIRNVFLESMCFIPEVVTEQGKAQIDLKLSDNITTWTIQTIGNTKEGQIGYGKLDNVKVFKEFFVDFELPKNSVETDKVSIPVTVYNYTDNSLTTTLKIQEEEWFKIEGKNEIAVNVEAKATKMVYVPITILKAGNNKFRVEATSKALTDIIEKEFLVEPKGYKVEKVVSRGNLEGDISEDLLILDEIIKDTASAKVKIYSSQMAQAVEGMENIFRMPTGCFEQISSTLYPNILALKYMEDNNKVDDKIRNRALEYISSGYQKLLTYEVKGEQGGYSLYGHNPAETVLTAYGLMEITDLSEVYDVDKNVIEEMTNYLYKKQNPNGTFAITGNQVGGASSRDKIALNAYITWALSESNPKEERLKKSVKYLKEQLDDIDDNYTLALIANTLANVKDKDADKVIQRLVNNINVNGNVAYATSNVTDYYGTRSNVQNIQTTALTSMALSKTSKNEKLNKQLINYLISQKDPRGTWHSTQATILALKALNEVNEKNKLENQTITVKVNGEEQKIEIKDNPLELYECKFVNLGKENKLNIDIEKGSAYYEVIEEYYIPYEKVDTTKDNIGITVEANQELKVNEIMEAKIRVANNSRENINNGMVTISIPQGFTVIEESLMELEAKGIIEKYEMTYTTVNIYLRNFERNQFVDLKVKFRAAYPVEITGLSVKAYDYYNPEVEGKSLPMLIRDRDF